MFLKNSLELFGSLEELQNTEESQGNQLNEEEKKGRLNFREGV